VSPVLKLFCYLYPKTECKINLSMEGEELTYDTPNTASQSQGNADTPVQEETALPEGTNSYRLSDLAYTRSGDKGNKCNIGVIARHPSFVPYIRQALTAEAVDTYMAHVFDDRSGDVSSRVQRFELPGIHGFNFLLHDALGGGGIASLRSDPQGKAFGQMLLDFSVEKMPNLEDPQA